MLVSICHCTIYHMFNTSSLLYIYYRFVFLVHRHTLWVLHCSSPIPTSNPSVPVLQLLWALLSWFFFSFPKKCFNYMLILLPSTERKREKCRSSRLNLPISMKIFTHSLPFLSSPSHTLLSSIQSHFSSFTIWNLIRNEGSTTTWLIDQYALHV